MIDLHTHSLLSDGVLLPSELVQRCKEKGYRALAITDHVDASNLEWVTSRLVAFVSSLREVEKDIEVLAGVELTHLPPSQIAFWTKRARELGAEVIVVHGQTVVEPVPEGTNYAALKADTDILSHPGLIKEEEVLLARERGIFLELTSRKGHCLTNGHVAASARRLKAPLILNSDSHGPGDLLSLEEAQKVAMGSGLTKEEFEALREEVAALLVSLKGKSKG